MKKEIKKKAGRGRDKLTSADIKKYYLITEKALRIVKGNGKGKSKIAKGREIDGHQIILMAESYLFDSQFFEKNGDLINAFGAIYYAHGWIDCGVRLGIFDVKDDKLFTVR